MAQPSMHGISCKIHVQGMIRKLFTVPYLGPSIAVCKHASITLQSCAQPAEWTVGLQLLFLPCVQDLVWCFLWGFPAFSVLPSRVCFLRCRAARSCMFPCFSAALLLPLLACFLFWAVPGPLCFPQCNIPPSSKQYSSTSRMRSFDSLQA